MTPINSLSNEEWLALVHEALSMPHAPSHLVQNAVDLWDRVPAAPALRQRWVAVLSFDSWARSPVAAGMRSPPAAARQLVFSAEGFDVDLRISPADGAFTWSGQLLGASGEARMVLVTIGKDGDERFHRSIEFDAAGVFRVDRIERGIYRATVQANGQEVVLTSIEVGSPGPATPS